MSLLLDLLAAWMLAAFAALVVLRWRYGPHHVVHQWTMAFLWPWPLCVWLVELLDSGDE